VSAALTRRPSPSTPAITELSQVPGPGSRRWLEAQQRDLLNTNYFHVVFTVPHELNPLALTSRRRLLDLLFEASSQSLLEVAADPQRLGAEIGFLSILHTWSSNLLPHLPYPRGRPRTADCRMIISGWIHTSHPLFLLPVPVLPPSSAKVPRRTSSLPQGTAQPQRSRRRHSAAMRASSN